MAKGKATTAKGKGKAHAKAPPKKAMPSKNTAPKKAPACPHNTKGKGSHKQAADDLDDASLGESSREEEDPRPQKKHCGKQKEISDEEGMVKNLMTRQCRLMTKERLGHKVIARYHFFK